jgi:hypothetical protein
MSTMHPSADSPQPTLAGLVRSHAETIAHLRDNHITDTSFATYLAEQPGCRWTALQIVREIQRQRARVRPRTISPEEKSVIESMMSGVIRSTNGHSNGNGNGATHHDDNSPATGTAAAPAPAAPPRSSIVPASSRESHLD